MSQVNLFFRVDRSIEGDMYTFKPHQWYCARGDFMDDPTKALVQDYFARLNPRVKVDFEFRNEPDCYGTYSERFEGVFDETNN